MKIIVTGNPNYEGLCKGIKQVFGPNVEFIGRWNGWNVTDLDAVADYVKDFDIFINSQYGSNGEQITLLKKVYAIFKGKHIINISSTSAYWANVSDTTKPLDQPEDFPKFDVENYVKNKTALDEASKELCKNTCWGTNKIRISNIAYGQLASKYQLLRNNVNKISLTQAANIVKWVIDSPDNLNVHYVSVDPIQRDQ
jgi:NAD(P)-dependent dehydrogenase (short-subunit alcohol dehydrogenase family)